MREAEPEVLAYMGFAAPHCAKLHSTNPIARLNGDVRQPTKSSASSNAAAIIRVVGAIHRRGRHASLPREHTRSIVISHYQPGRAGLPRSTPFSREMPKTNVVVSSPGPHCSKPGPNLIPILAFLLNGKVEIRARVFSTDAQLRHEQCRSLCQAQEFLDQIIWIRKGSRIAVILSADASHRLLQVLDLLMEEHEIMRILAEKPDSPARGGIDGRNGEFPHVLNLGDSERLIPVPEQFT
jgi:hypothetical protein